MGNSVTVYIIHQTNDVCFRRTARLAERIIKKWVKNTGKSVDGYAVYTYDHYPTVEKWTEVFRYAGSKSVYVWYMGHGPMSSEGHPILKLGSTGKIDAASLIQKVQSAKYINIIADCCFQDDAVRGICPRYPDCSESVASNLVFGARPGCVLLASPAVLPNTDIGTEQWTLLSILILEHLDADEVFDGDFWKTLTRSSFKAVKKFNEKHKNMFKEVGGHRFAVQATAYLVPINDEL